MKHKSNYSIGLYFVCLLCVSLCALNVLPEANKNYITDSKKNHSYVKCKISSPEFYTLSFMNHMNSNFRYINFNAEITDTVFSSGDSQARLKIENYPLINPTSVKWKPVLNNLPYAVCFSVQELFEDSGTCSEWKFRTVLSANHKMNVISLMTNNENLFGYKTGIYTFGVNHATQDQKGFKIAWWDISANWQQRGKESKRPVRFQYLNNSGKLLLESNASMRISGNATRGFPQKSLRIKIEEKKKFIIGDESPIEINEEIILRNSGNDWGRTLLADAFIQSLLKKTNLLHQQQKPVVVYLNGSYWGIHWLTNRLDENFIGNKYACKKRHITLLEGLELDYGKDENKQEFIELVNYCQTRDLSNDKYFEFVNERIDISNLILYSAVNIYSANTDWPGQNVKAVKIKNHNSGKWFFLIRDMDCSYSYSGNTAYELDMFEFIAKKKDGFSVIFNSLMKNSKFKKQLHETLKNLLNNEFNTFHQLMELNKFSTKIESEILNHINRWRKPLTVEKWRLNIEDFRQFILNRHKYVKLHLKRHLNG